MEDVLSVYERPYNPKYPVVCVDECKKELRSTPRGELPIEAGQGKREDYEYVRAGAANLFLAVEPLAGRRMLSITERRTSVDFAYFLKRVSDEFCPEAEAITIVLDNLNTHKPWSLYAAFPAEEAYRLMNRFEFHYTPEHGSWLNMAEIEISVMQRQCLNRRLDRVSLERGQCLGDVPQRVGREDRLAVYDQGCSGKVAPSLPNREVASSLPETRSSRDDK